MENLVPRPSGNMNIVTSDLMPGMVFADGFVITSFYESNGARFAVGEAYGFIPGMRYIGQVDLPTLATIKVAVN